LKGDSKPLIAYVYSLLTLFAALEVHAYWKYGLEGLGPSLVFLSMAVGFEMFETGIMEGSGSRIIISGGMAANVVAALILNPFESSAVAALSVCISRVHRLKRSPVKYVFNVSQIGLSTFLISRLSDYLGLEGIWVVLTPVTSSLLYTLLNVTFVSLAAHLSGSGDFRRFFRRTIPIPFYNSIFAVPAVTSIVILYEYAGFITVPIALGLLFSVNVGLYYRRLYEDAKIENLKILAKSLEERDEYTYGHSQKVAEISEKIARRLGYSEKHIERIKTAALLHDIGKIGIPDSVLRKTGKLSEEEFEEIKKHPVKGWEILSGIKRFQKKEALWVKHHHERMDGSGYPDGLSGEEIPIESRIIAVADVFDALTSDRPYRKAMGVGEALRVMERMKGKAIDGKVFEVLKELIEEGKI